MAKKILTIALILAFCMSIIAVAGCGQTDDTQGTTQDESPNGEAPEEAKIVVGGWPAADTAFEAAMEGFNDRFPEIEVELSMMDTTDFHQQLTTAIAAGSGAVDVAMLEQAWVGRYRNASGFENLLDEPYNAGRFESDFVDYKWELALSLDRETLVGLVWDIGPATLFYRRDVFDDAGLPSEPDEVEELLSTWEGVLEAAEQVYIPNERWLLPNAYYLYTWNYMNRDFYNEQLELNIEKAGSVEALEASITMRQNDWDAQLSDMWSNEATAALASGSVAMVVAGCWYGGFLKTWIAPDESGNWGIARLPGSIADSNWGGSYLAIPSQSENKDAAWKFIEYMLTTSQAQNEMFESVDYFPGYIPAWDDPMYDETDPYFGGQKTRELWVDISKSIEPSFSTLMDATTEGALANAVNTGLNDGMSAQEIIDYAKQQIEIETRQDREEMIDMLTDAGRWED